MRLLFAAVSSAGCLIACSLLTSAQNIDTSFNVDGSCDDDQKAILNTMGRPFHNRFLDLQLNLPESGNADSKFDLP